MRKSVLAVTAAAVTGFGGSVLAGDPVMMTDTQMDTVVAGDARKVELLVTPNVVGNTPAPVEPIDNCVGAGPAGQPSSGRGGGTVAVFSGSC